MGGVELQAGAYHQSALFGSDIAISGVELPEGGEGAVELLIIAFFALMAKAIGSRNGVVIKLMLVLPKRFVPEPVLPEIGRGLLDVVAKKQADAAVEGFGGCIIEGDVGVEAEFLAFKVTAARDDFDVCQSALAEA